MAAEDARLGQFDLESTREHLSALRSIMGAIEELDPEDLQREIDRTALLGEIRSSVYRLEYEQPNRRNPAFWLLHLFQSLYSLLTRDDSSTPARVNAVAARLRAIPSFVDSARATIDQPASIFVDTALGMLGGGGELIAEIVGAFGRAAPDMSGELEQAGEEALKALVGFGAALRDQIEPSRDPQAFAVGDEQFDRRLQHEHAIKASAGELWRYGNRLQEEVTGQLAAQAEQLGSSSWRALVDSLRDDSPRPDELLGVYREEIERACRFTTERDLVGLPDARVEVVTTPRHLAPVIPFAAYEPPPIYLAGRSGRFYVTKPDSQHRGHCRHAIPAMVAHEVYPGHHLHLATMQGNRSEVRRHIWSPITVEGWAVYCEQLMAEAGYYQTAEARLFQLVNLLWRAIRIIVDVGLHTRGLTPAEAARYMVQHLPIEQANAEAEVRRYCAWPTYQLCYAVGRRELLSLREAYRQRHGGQISFRQFHDELMGFGGMPVSLARWGMELAE